LRREREAERDPGSKVKRREEGKASGICSQCAFAYYQNVLSDLEMNHLEDERVNFKHENEKFQNESSITKCRVC